MRERLEELESSLAAISRHLRKLGEDADEAEVSRVLTMERIGELLGPASRGGDRGNQHTVGKSANKDLPKSKGSRMGLAASRARVGG